MKVNYEGKISLHYEGKITKRMQKACTANSNKQLQKEELRPQTHHEYMPLIYSNNSTQL